MNLFTKQKQSHGCRKRTMVTRGLGWGEINWETGVDMYTLLYTKQIANKNMQCSTENSTQYSVTVYMEKDSKNNPSGYMYN